MDGSRHTPQELALIARHIQWHHTYVNFLCMSQKVYNAVNRWDKNVQKQKHYDKDTGVVYWNVQGVHRGRATEQMVEFHLTSGIAIFDYRGSVKSWHNRDEAARTLLQSWGVFYWAEITTILDFVQNILKEMHWI